MKSPGNSVFVINAGSSSIKFALYETEPSLLQLLYGQVENIGHSNACLTWTNNLINEKKSINIDAVNYDTAVKHLGEWLKNQADFVSIKAIGHRIVHGMNHSKPALITAGLLSDIKKIIAYDPEHLPLELKLIDFFTQYHPGIPQIACFDTSFHTGMPDVAKLLPIPKQYRAKGIQRYGFHGLSYAYLVEELGRLQNTPVAPGKIILAHLGNGASLAAVKNGKSMDTSMGFTPASGLTMSTRTGDLDPGVAWYLMQAENLSPEQFSKLINHESGLLGISGTSGDMRELIKNRKEDIHAAEAVDFFCYQVKKWIGSFTAVLGGLDTLVFSGGIGEHSPEVRRQVCDGLQFLGIELDETRNEKNESIISADRSKACVRVIHTNEELMIAKLVCKVLNNRVNEKHD
ncbi:MAG: acetate/propionate family kinase [Bacteroidota bacterium]